MVLPVYPALPGLILETPRRAIWSTDIKTSDSGTEYRRERWKYPVYEFDLQYDVLDDTFQNGTYSQLLGFFNGRRGASREFRFLEPSYAGRPTADNAVTNQLLGVGDGVTKRFQLVVDRGEFIEPIKDAVDGFTITVAGAATTAFSVDVNGGIVFTAAPPVSAPVMWTGQYYRRCRFKEDTLEATPWAEMVWETGTVTLRTIKWVWEGELT